MPHDDRNQISFPIRNKGRDVGKDFFMFVEDLDDEDRVRFLRSLTEQEMIDFSGSREEFRMTVGREPHLPWPEAKPDFQEDVTMSVVDQEKLSERLDKARNMFPGHPPKSLDEMRALTEPKSHDGMKLQLMINISQGDIDREENPSMSLDKMRKKASGSED